MKYKVKKICFAVAIIAGMIGTTAFAAIKTPVDKFVRTANYFLRAGTDIRPADYPALASYDLLILPAEAQVYNRDMFWRLRELHPNIIILAYVPTKSYNFGWTDSLHQRLAAGIQDDWWLLDPGGNRISVWPNTAVISSVSGWNEYLPRFVHDEIYDTALWDGVFYDEFSANASWMNGGNVDLHRDGIKDDPALLDTAWRQGTINLLKNTRDLLGPNAIIVTNGDSTDVLQPYVNGRMFESFPTPWEAGGTWAGVMANYLHLPALVGYSPVFIINGNTGDTGNDADYKKVRYDLASTLMGDGFFSYDFGESDHGELWHYDEEDAHLGAPAGNAVNLLAPNDRRIVGGVWRRDFQNGVVLVNATDKPRTVSFGEELEKLRGAQAPDVNDGSIVTNVVLPAADGIILRKRVERITDAAFPNGAFVRLYDAAGTAIRNGFFSYEAGAPGATNVAVVDMFGDGQLEKIVAGKTAVAVYAADGRQLTLIFPYGTQYANGVTLAVGDLDGDGKPEIVTGTGPGGGPHVRIFKADGTPIGGFFAYDPRFRGGVNVAAGDLYGTGRPVIVTGEGPGGGPEVRVFSRFGKVLHPGFFAYDPRFRGGVNVAVGDVNGDGNMEIITGAGPGGGPHVRIFNRYGAALGKGFFAGDPSSRTGVRVAVTDTDGDGTPEIAAFITDVFRFSASGPSAAVQ